MREILAVKGLGAQALNPRYQVPVAADLAEAGAERRHEPRSEQKRLSYRAKWVNVILLTVCEGLS